ncbi:alpha/beta fold hydrolase [Jannaschia sp. W003]|uniref:alpha/beta fold hydrolase n=1 Tax=Jannaschia sp. W003 TaxID=2867012 RepID=UPI0021A288CA|nr:alpha/beta hydrolase [Jannaschia sp. W003]UWQ21425.1 alpha/beta hydrolase [Jannaschia sp. W003]
MRDAPMADVIEAGAGPRVVLVHSSGAGARQWRGTMERLAERFHLLAPNLHGYGATPPWPEGRPQTLADQAALVAPLLRGGGPVSLVGHSFGASVAMRVAAEHPDRVRRLVLLEPNPFWLLRLHGRAEAFAEVERLRDLLCGAADDAAWEAAGARFADYWNGAGTWAAMPEARRARFLHALRPNRHEWAAVMDEAGTVDAWAARLPRATTVIAAADTVRPIAGIVALLRNASPGWRFETLPEGGHMAPLSRPDLVEPLMEAALH